MRAWVTVCFLVACGASAPRVHPPAGPATVRFVPQLAGDVTLSAWSPDGRLLLTGEGTFTPGRVRVWDVETGLLLRVFTRHRRGLGEIAFAPDSRTAISASTDGVVHVWDVVTGQVVRTFETRHEAEHDDRAIDAFAISQDGRRLLAAHGSRDAETRVALWDLATGAMVRGLAADPFPVRGVALSPDGTVGASCSDYGVRLWNLATGADLRYIPLDEHLVRIRFSPDGKRVMAAATRGDDRNDPGEPITHVWEVATGREIATLDAHGIEFVTRDRVLALDPTSAPHARVEIRDFAAALIRVSVDGYAGSVSRDGTLLFTVGDKALAVRDAETGATRRAFQVSYPTNSGGLSFSADGKLLVAAGEETMQLWDLATLSPRPTKPGEVAMSKVRFVDAQHFVQFEGTTPRWLLVDTQSGSVQEKTVARHGRRSMGLSDDGRHVFAREDDETVTIYDAATAAKVASYPNKLGDDVWFEATFSPDGTRVAMSRERLFTDKQIVGGEVAIYDTATQQRLRTFGAQIGGVAPMQWSADGHRVLVKDRDAKVSVWDADRGELVRAFPTGATDARFVGDGSHVAIANDAGGVTVWDVATGARRELADANAPFAALAVSPDGRLIAAASWDGTLRLWRSDGAAAVSLLADRSNWVVYADDGLFDASRGGGRLMAAVDGVRPYRIDQLALRNNRPDELLRRMGLGDAATIEHFRARRERRLAKAGIREDRLAASFATAPTAAFVKTDVDGKYASIAFELTARGEDLRRYNIFVNGVPLHGAGRAIAGRRFAGTERVELVPGPNRIEIAATDAGGAESLHATSNALLTEGSNGDLYYIGFGVSEYRDPSYRLGFPRKDVVDLGAVFAAMEGDEYEHVHVATFVDAQATVANLRAAKQLLAKAKVDDTVVLFVAGHGIHAADAAADYYFATYETDIDKLATTAAKFELVESLLEDIAPRQKLLLMDTCESGELDDAAEARTLAAASSRKLVSRGLVRTKKASRPRAYLRDRERFIELDPTLRSGAVVLSSSRGSELSYEMAELRNGVFTEQLLVALTGDGYRLSMRDLLQQVSAGVAATTQDLQHPTIDRDNRDAALMFPRVPKARWIVTRP